MKPRLPPVVVIQERHVKYGERFKILKVNTNKRREYVSKFLSARKYTFRSKSKQVSIGRMTKELSYKGSPLAISRVLLLNGLKDAFPQFGQNCNNDGSEKREADSASSPTLTNPPLSFFNLSDRRPTTMKIKGGAAETSVGPTTIQNIRPPIVELGCTPQNLNDFHLLFGSDTANSDEESDTEEDGLVVVEVDNPILPPQTNTENKQQTAMNNTIKKIEKDVKNIASNLNAALEAAAQKVTVSFPPSTATSSNQTQTTALSTECSSVGTPRNQTSFGNCQLVTGPSNCQTNPLNCPYMQPSGSLPFFRVPGGCIMVVQATNANTPALNATFMTGNSYHQQYQQLQMPIYGMCQVVAIHIGHYRLGREEINRIYNFISTSNISTNPPRF